MTENGHDGVWCVWLFFFLFIWNTGRKNEPFFYIFRINGNFDIQMRVVTMKQIHASYSQYKQQQKTTKQNMHWNFSSLKYNRNEITNMEQAQQKSVNSLRLLMLRILHFKPLLQQNDNQLCGKEVFSMYIVLQFWLCRSVVSNYCSFI